MMDKAKRRRPGSNQSSRASEHQKAADDLAAFLTRQGKLRSGEIESGRDSPRAHNAWIRDQLSNVSIDISLARDALLRAMRSARVRTVRSGRFTFTDAADRFHIQEEKTGMLKPGRGESTAGNAILLGEVMPRRTLQALVEQDRRK